jgi:hypothetical protein
MLIPILLVLFIVAVAMIVYGVKGIAEIASAPLPPSDRTELASILARPDLSELIGQAKTICSALNGNHKTTKTALKNTCQAIRCYKALRDAGLAVHGATIRFSRDGKSLIPGLSYSDLQEIDAVSLPDYLISLIGRSLSPSYNPTFDDKNDRAVAIETIVQLKTLTDDPAFQRHRETLLLAPEELYQKLRSNAA